MGGVRKIVLLIVKGLPLFNGGSRGGRGERERPPEGECFCCVTCLIEQLVTRLIHCVPSHLLHTWQV